MWEGRAQRRNARDKERCLGNLPGFLCNLCMSYSCFFSVDSAFGVKTLEGAMNSTNVVPRLPSSQRWPHQG